MTLKTVFKNVMLYGIGIFCLGAAITKCLDALSTASDFGVEIGFLGLLVLLALVIYIGTNGVKRIMGSNFVKNIMGSLGMVFLAVVLLFSSGCNKFISPGHVGVMVNLYGKNRGVQDTTIVTGRVWYNPWTRQIYDFPTFLQYKVWTSDEKEGDAGNQEISFTSKDKIRVAVDVSTGYQFLPDKIPSLFVFLREDPTTIANTYIRTQVRNQFVIDGSSLNAMDILGSGIGEIDNNVTKHLNENLEPLGIHFDYVNVVGKPRIPEAIEQAIEQTILSTQQAQKEMNQVNVVKALADQKVARADGDAQAILAVATAQAKANQVLSSSLTPELVQSQAIAKWNGNVPQFTGGSSPVPFINLNNGMTR